MSVRSARRESASLVLPLCRLFLLPDPKQSQRHNEMNLSRRSAEGPIRTRPVCLTGRAASRCAVCRGPEGERLAIGSGSLRDRFQACTEERQLRIISGSSASLAGPQHAGIAGAGRTRGSPFAAFFRFGSADFIERAAELFQVTVASTPQPDLATSIVHNRRTPELLVT